MSSSIVAPAPRRQRSFDRDGTDRDRPAVLNDIGRHQATGSDGTGPDRDRQAAVVGIGAILPTYGILTTAQLAAPGPPSEFTAAATLGRKGLRFKDRATLLALVAVDQALRDAGASVAVEEVDDIGLVVASCYGNVGTVCRIAKEIDSGGVRSVSPMDLPNASANIICSTLAIKYGWRGVNLTVVGSPNGGSQALDVALNLIAAGRSKTVVVVAVEAAGEHERSIREGLPLADGAVCVVLCQPQPASAEVMLHRAGQENETTGAQPHDDGIFAGLDPAALATVLPVAAAVESLRTGRPTGTINGLNGWALLPC